MGCSVSSEAAAKSRKIDHDLRMELLKRSKEVKLLLLGELLYSCKEDPSSFQK
jgi:hypothetical protein